MTPARKALLARLTGSAAYRLPTDVRVEASFLAYEVMAATDATRTEREANIRPAQKHVPSPPPGMHVPDKGIRSRGAVRGFGGSTWLDSPQPVKKAKKKGKPPVAKKPLSATDKALFGERPWWEA